MSSPTDQSVYYVPHNGWYPVWVAFGAFMLLAGLGTWLNDVKSGADPSAWMMYVGGVVLAVVLFYWFAKVVEESRNNLEARRDFLQRPEEVPEPTSVNRCVHCGDRIHFEPTDHSHLGRCAKGKPQSIAGFWTSDPRNCL